MKPTFTVKDAMPHWHAVLLVQFTITHFTPEWTNRAMLSIESTSFSYERENSVPKWAFKLDSAPAAAAETRYLKCHLIKVKIHFNLRHQIHEYIMPIIMHCTV